MTASQQCLNVRAEISQPLLDLLADSKRLFGFNEFVTVNENKTAEMFLSIITLLQLQLPCALGFHN